MRHEPRKVQVFSDLNAPIGDVAIEEVRAIAARRPVGLEDVQNLSAGELSDGQDFRGAGGGAEGESIFPVIPKEKEFPPP